MANQRGRTLLIVLILLSAVLLAVGNVLCHALVVQEMTGIAPPPEGGFTEQIVHSIGQSVGQRPQFVWFFTGAPLLIGIILALLAGLSGNGGAEPAAAKVSGTDGSSDGALRLLALLQKEGRLVDFLEEDIQPYTDAQVGAAVRAIHAGCRKALHERMEIARIYPEDDGATVEVASGFDPASVRLTGNVHGQPPFHGVLQHGGWRATHVSLPKTAGVDAAVLAPAEVEVG